MAIPSAQYVHDFENHFFHKRGYWYQRVWMPFMKGTKASSGILQIQAYMESELDLKEYLMDDLVEHFKYWARRCRAGRCKLTPGIAMYEH